MNHAKTSFSREICAGAIISVFQYLALLQYAWYAFLPFTKYRTLHVRQCDAIHSLSNARPVLRPVVWY
jgi:hypothetical protein